MWSDVRINKRKLFSDGVTSYFSIPRFENAEKIDLSRCWFSKHQWYDILTQIVNSGHTIEELNLAEAQLQDVQLELFGEAICKARRVNVARVQIQSLDWENVFRKLARSNTIRQLDLSDNFLALIPSDLFVTTLANLEEVELKDALITNEQLQALISRSKDTKTKLSVNIICENVHESPVHLPSAFFQLQKISLCLEDYTDLTAARWSAVLRSVVMSPVLEEVSVEGVSVDLCGVEPLLLAASHARLNRLRLSGVQLTEDQWRLLLARLSYSHLSLRMVNMTSVDGSLLSRSLASLASLSLEYAALTQQQWESLLSSCHLAASLSVLKISHINLSHVPAHIMASLTLSCSYLDLSNTGLLPHQLEELLTVLPRSSVIRDLSLQGLDLSALEDNLVARAAVHLVRVSLRKTKLTTKQATALFIANLGRSKLKVLDLCNVNLSGVDSDVAALSLTRFREVDLSCTWLTKDQIVRLAHQVSKFTKLEFLKLQYATASLLSQDMKQTLRKNLKLVIS